MNKRQIAQIQKKFDGFTVLNASEDGMRICLTSEETGLPYGYVYKDEEDKNHVFPERIAQMQVDAVFAFDAEHKVEVDIEQIVDRLSAKLISANSAISEKDKRRDRLPLIHIKDYLDLSCFPPAFTAIGTGHMENGSIIRCAEDLDVEWVIVEQDNSPIDELESARISIENIRKSISGIN